MQNSSLPSSCIFVITILFEIVLISQIDVLQNDRFLNMGLIYVISTHLIYSDVIYV
jgi:hypothetical protein